MLCKQVQHDQQDEERVPEAIDGERERAAYDLHRRHLLLEHLKDHPRVEAHTKDEEPPLHRVGELSRLVDIHLEALLLEALNSVDDEKDEAGDWSDGGHREKHTTGTAANDSLTRAEKPSAMRIPNQRGQRVMRQGPQQQPHSSSGDPWCVGDGGPLWFPGPAAPATGRPCSPPLDEPAEDAMVGAEAVAPAPLPPPGAAEPLAAWTTASRVRDI